MKGGYQIIDFGNLDLTTDGGVVIKGSYNKAKTGKAILGENINIGGTTVKGAFLYSFDAGDEGIITSLGLPSDDGMVFGIIAITSEDTVSINLYE